ncbi:hypothetical protein EIP86_001945 [Pleurotus ostreatoroseus]|nr:hypothetical protein EIP86_001945 [Pleurotus ostreatoroseus]
MLQRYSQTHPTGLTKTVLAAFALSQSYLEAFAIWPFPPKRFSGNSLISAGSLGVDTDDRVIAFGDFNGDQFLDILGLGTDQQTLSLYLWNHENYNFVKTTDFLHPVKVLNAVPGDFTQDGKLDILIMGQGSPSNQLFIDLYVGLPQGGFGTWTYEYQYWPFFTVRFEDLHPVSAPYSALPQPIPMDMSGDLKIDLFGTLPTTSPDSRFKVWRNVWNESQPNSPVFELTDPKMSGAQCKLSNPHSNAAVDLNGDCLADLFLVCDEDGTPDKYFQIWVNNKDDGFSLAQLGRLPRGLQSVTFGDIG